MASVRRAQAVLSAIVVAAVLGAFSYACGPAGFDPQAKLTGVRVLSARTDKPYAKPGDDVTVEMLAVDARKTPKLPMKLYWLPFVCENPFNDLYYACFAPLLGGDGGVADGGGGADAGAPIFRPGLDITPFLKEGTKYSFKIAPDIITRHKPVAGAVPYGLAITFAVACAGHVRTVAIDPNNINPQKVPIGCFDDDGNQLGPDDFVFTFSRVYVYDKRTNANPEVQQVLFDGKPVDLTQGVVVDRCNGDADCVKHPIDLTIPDSSWELNEGQLGKDGTTLGEELYGLYYYTVDKVEKEGRLLFDPSAGRVSGSANNFIAQSVPGQGRVYVVVHDNRGGATWVDFPVFVK